ncbi:hypothetical protein ACS0TY_021804 [Phlomoides rotata]
MGYIITDRISIPHFDREFLGFTVNDYYFDGAWHLDEFFVMKHLEIEIIEDMMNYSCDADSDFLVWPHSVHGSLSTKVAYAGLQQRYPIVSWGNWIWSPFVPTKRSTVIWRIIHGKLPTWDHIRFRGFSRPSQCVFCYAVEEDLGHLFCHALGRRTLFHRFLLFLMFISVSTLVLDIGCCRRSGGTLALRLRLCVVTIIWVIWDHHNKRVFEGFILRDSSLLAGF